MSPWDGIGNPIRFKEWYSSFGPVFHNISTGICNETLAAYLADYKSLTTKTCDFHVDCVLGEVSESIKAKNASAAIFLGILPSMLAMLGPSMTQLALLSTRRPLLSLLIALGSVGFYLDRLFRLETPTEILSMVQGERLIPRLRSSRWGFVVSVLEYLVVATAVLNVLNMAVRVGDRTIMSFRCNMWSLPLIWVTSLAGIFFLVAIPFQFSAVAKHMRNCTGDGARSSVDAGPEGLGDTQWTPLPPRPEWTRQEQHPGAPNGGLERRSTADSVSQFVAREFTPGMRHPSLRVHEIPQFEPWVAVLFNVGFFFAAFHIIIGTCWLSSTLFLSPGDAIRIVLRFFGSAVVCRFVVMVELASMKSQEMPQGEK